MKIYFRKCQWTDLGKGKKKKKKAVVQSGQDKRLVWAFSKHFSLTSSQKRFLGKNNMNNRKEITEIYGTTLKKQFNGSVEVKEKKETG